MGRVVPVEHAKRHLSKLTRFSTKATRPAALGDTLLPHRKIPPPNLEDNKMTALEITR